MSSNRKHGEPQATMKDVFAKFADVGIDVPAETAMSDYIDIVFDGPPAQKSGRFIEVEDSSGASISAGDWVEDGDLWRLRINNHSAELAAITKERDELSVKAGRLKEEVGVLWVNHDEWVKAMVKVEKERDELKAEVERLKEFFKVMYAASPESIKDKDGWVNIQLRGVESKASDE